MYDRYQFNILLMYDELFAATKKRLTDFCDALIVCREKYGWDFDWQFQTHANARLDKEAFELAKKAGCTYFSYGMESASTAVLDSMEKKTHPDQISEAIALAQEAKLGFGGNFIFGDPAETQSTIAETVDFYREHCIEAHVYISEVRPYPGSKLYLDCLEQGIIKDQKPSYEEDIKGSLEPGKLADMVILSDDPLTCAEDNIADIVAETTIVGGQIVYQRSSHIQ